jgi:hypothetical protein
MTFNADGGKAEHVNGGIEAQQRNAQAMTPTAPTLDLLTDPDAVIALTLPDDMPAPQWRAMGKALSTARRKVDWMIGDWIAHGRAHHPDQIEMALADDMGIAPAEARRIEAVTKAFPAHARHKALTFDHHAHVAALPLQEALPLLKAAHEEGVSAKEMRMMAMLRKVELRIVLPRDEHDDDPDYTQAKAIAAYWNRASRAARETFLDLANEADLGVIEV